MDNIEIRYSNKNTSPDVIRNILEIEKDVYEPQYCGTFESVKSRFDKFNEMFILAYDNDKLAGYLCYFPISDRLHDEILNTNSLHDDEICPDDIEDVKGDTDNPLKNHFYLISVAVSSEYHKKGVGKALMDGFFEKLRSFEAIGILTDDILASTVTKDGEKTVKKYGFKQKASSSGYQVYQKTGLAMYSDVYVMVPVSGKLNKKYLDTDATVNKYIELINENFKDECSKEFTDTIERMNLGKIEFNYYENDSFDDSTPRRWIDAYMYYTYQEITDLGIITIMIDGSDVDDSQIGEIAFNNLIELRSKDAECCSLEKYLEMLNLNQCGRVRIIYCDSLALKRDSHVAYLLSGEAEYSKVALYDPRKEVVDSLLSNNLSRYDFYELYATGRSVVYLLKDFKDNFEDRLEQEALFIYICEVAVLQNAAVYRANKKIIDELTRKSNITARKTLELHVEFGKTIILWDNKIYNYSLAQELANDIVEAFGTPKLFEEFNYNNEHIDRIANLKNGISTDIEGKVLNLLAFILSVSELVTLIINIVNYSTGHPLIVGLSSGGIVLILILMTIIRIRNKHK